jgi:hypothetical protein
VGKIWGSSFTLSATAFIIDVGTGSGEQNEHFPKMQEIALIR